MSTTFSSISDGTIPEPGETCVYDAPMALNHDLSHTAGLDPQYGRSRHQGHIYEMLNCIVGPMPLDKFMCEAVGAPLLSNHDDAALSSRNAFRSIPRAAQAPEEIYESLLTALSKRTKNKSRCPGFYFEATARRSTHPRYPGFAKPHICCFAERNREAVKRLDRHSRSELGYAELIIHVAGDASQDPFTDPPAELGAEERATFDFFSRRKYRTGRHDVEDALGLHMGFVAEAFARQHRHAFYSVSMAGSRARLLRWDRAGCIVSEAFCVRNHPERLCDFLWRFASTSDAARGHDPTVEHATLEQEVQFRDAIREHVRLQLGVEGDALEKALTQHYAPGHVAVMDVYGHRRDVILGNAYGFLISRPVVSPDALVGRCTWGYWAVDLGASRVYFIKDTWRYAPEVDVEGFVLAHLNSLKIRNIPTVAAHGDVPLYVPDDEFDSPTWQTSLASKYKHEPWLCRVAGKPVTIHEQQRYRLVLSTVGYGLPTIRGTEELLHATFDAFIAMRDALAKDSRIHRDISVGNIILVRTPGERVRRGYLIDWEVSTRVDESGEALYSGRAGTWLFTSWRMLQHTEPGVHVKHTFLDDVESLVHVVTYCALRYLPHALNYNALNATIESYFEEKIEDGDGSAHGGHTKHLNALSPFVIWGARFASSALQEWLVSMWGFQCPPEHTGHTDDYGPKWTGDHIEAFWSEFLRTHELERDNRVVHDIARAGRVDYNDGSLSPTPPTRPRLGKRPAGDSLSEDAVVRDSKRRCSMRLQGLTAAPAPSPHATATYDNGTRRSQRLRAAQERAQPRTGATAASAHAARSRTPTGRGTARGRARSRR
ncbi:hypothetical protein C8Q77DRAFT_1234583 [Trametes polyzona]|nr:hypothetical protein C8Q77DRAFT_1234583 [Trametes polyzona]